MRLPNPYNDLPYERVSQNKDGQDEYGYRMVEGVEEIIHIPSGKSNMSYHKPEKYTFFENCTHVFRVVDIRMREVECKNAQCHLLTAFHPAVNYREENGKGYIKLNGKEYLVEF